MSDHYLRHQSLPTFETEAVYLQIRIYFQLLKRLKEKKKTHNRHFSESLLVPNLGPYT